MSIKLAIIADSEFENIFDNLSNNEGFKDAQFDGHSCAFLPTSNSFKSNLSVIKKLGVGSVIEITNKEISNQEFMNEKNIEYIGFSVKGNSKTTYIKTLVKSAIKEQNEFNLNNKILVHIKIIGNIKEILLNEKGIK